MKKLIDLANRIKDVELRKKVVEFIKNPTLSHKEFRKYPKMQMEEAKTVFGSSQGGTVERDVLNHTITLAELCIRMAEVVKKNYGVPLNEDDLLAAAIVHDYMHLYEYKKTKAGIESTGILLDHTMLAVAELYHRGFPEKIIHIVAAHFGESGPTPPRNFEALIFHHLDNLLAMVEFHMQGAKAQQPVELMLFDEDTLKKIAEQAMNGEKTEK